MGQTAYSKFLIMFVMIIVSFLFGFGYIYWEDLKDELSDWGEGKPRAENVLQDVDLPEPGKFLLRPRFNDIHRVKTSPLKLDSVEADGVHVSFVLNNLGGGNDYPDLKVSVLNESHQLVRSILLSPAMYKHGTRLRSESIQLTIPVRPGESSVSVEPFYAGKDAS